MAAPDTQSVLVDSSVSSSTDWHEFKFSDPYYGQYLKLEWSSNHGLPAGTRVVDVQLRIEERTGHAPIWSDDLRTGDAVCDDKPLLQAKYGTEHRCKARCANLRDCKFAELWPGGICQLFNACSRTALSDMDVKIFQMLPRPTIARKMTIANKPNGELCAPDPGYAYFIMMTDCGIFQDMIDLFNTADSTKTQNNFKDYIARYTAAGNKMEDIIDHWKECMSKKTYGVPTPWWELTKPNLCAPADVVARADYLFNAIINVLGDPDSLTEFVRKTFGNLIDLVLKVVGQFEVLGRKLKGFSITQLHADMQAAVNRSRNDWSPSEGWDNLVKAFDRTASHVTCDALNFAFMVNAGPEFTTG